MRRAIGADEIRFAHRRFVEQDIGRGIFEQQRPADGLLDLVDVVAHRRERRLRVGQRQQVVEIDGLVRRPGEMLGDQRGLVALERGRGNARDAPCPSGCGPPIDMQTPCSETAWSLRIASRAR